MPISLRAAPLSPPHPPPPPPPRLLHTGNRSQIISSTLRATRQLLSPLWSPPVALVSLAPSSPSEWTFLCYRYSSGAKGGAGVMPLTAVSPRPLVSLLPTPCNTRLIGQSEEESPFPSGPTLPWWHCISDPPPPPPPPPRSPPAAEAGRWRRSLLELQRLACVHLTAALLNERSHPSSVSMLCLFPPHHNPATLCSSSQARQERPRTCARVCLCADVCVRGSDLWRAQCKAVVSDKFSDITARG